MKISPKVWSTKRTNEVIQQINRTGVIPRYNPFYNRDLELRGADLRWENSDEENVEYAKIFANPIYFAENYANVMTDKGIKIVKLRPYQRRNLIELHKYRHICELASRQIGKSIIVAIYLVHYILTNKDRNILLLSRNGEKVKELVSKIEVILRNLPMWLKPGIIIDQTRNKKYDNGINLIAENTTSNAGASVTAHLVYIDEFALVNHKFKHDFWTTVYPTMSSSDISKMIITSTPRGLDKFFDIYDGAINSKNKFHPIRVDWWEVPGHDEQWRLDQIIELGSEEDFNQEFGNQFLAGNKLLFNSGLLKKLKANELEFVDRELESLDDRNIEYSGYLNWHPSFDIERCHDENARFVWTVDLSDGQGGDYIVINMFQILPMTKDEISKLTIYGDEKDFFKLVQIGLFRANTIPLEYTAVIAYHLATSQFISENLKILLEVNHEGKYFITKMCEVDGEDNQIESESLFVQTRHSQSNEKLKIGLKNNESIRDMNCKIIKDKVKYGQIVLVEKRTVHESLSFSKDKDGKYRGEGNDDVIMTCVNLCSYFETEDFAEQCDELLEHSPMKFQEIINIKLNKTPVEDEDEDYADFLI